METAGAEAVAANLGWYAEQNALGTLDRSYDREGPPSPSGLAYDPPELLVDCGRIEADSLAAQPRWLLRCSDPSQRATLGRLGRGTFAILPPPYRSYGGTL
jgi:hypothetical protein